MKLSVIIVNYNVEHFLEQCLYSVKKALQNIPSEIWVVDNNSVDGSVNMLRDKFPDVKVIENKENRGFSAANNQALEAVSGEYVLLLNPDTIVEEECFEKTIRFMDNHPEAGALGVKMMDGAGNFLPESKRGLPTPAVAFYKIFGLAELFPKSKKFGKYHLTYLSQDEVHEVEVLSGAFMFIRKPALAKTGFLDESFFMYGEDIDLSYRLTKAGYINYYFPETRIIHYKGESTRKSTVNYVFLFYNAMRIFARKHYSKNNARLFSAMINMAIVFRASLAIIYRFIRKIMFPVADFCIIYTGYYIISLFYADIKFSSSSYYSMHFFVLVLPAYILLWIFCILLAGGYDKPVNNRRTLAGAFWGTVLILILYALLPEKYRFSRALILIGACWVMVALTLFRQLLRLFNSKEFGKPPIRLLIIGRDEECNRVHNLLTHAKVAPEEVHYVETQSTGNEPSWAELITVYNINQVIFCAKDLPMHVIMDAMSSIRRGDVEFKIAPPESWAVIGSSSIHTPGQLYVVDVHAIITTPNKRNKRLLDFSLAMLLLLLSPFVSWFERKPAGFFMHIFQVMIGKKSWVGYAGNGKEGKLPAIKAGVLSPMVLTVPSSDSGVIYDVNSAYARDYNIMTDIRIIFKGFRNLGNG